MKQWTASVEISEPEATTIFMDMLFEVPDDLYEKAITSLRKGEKLAEDVEEELLSLAELDFGIDSFDLYPEEFPQHAEFGSDEEYEKAVNEYSDRAEEYRKQCSVSRISVDGVSNFLQLQLDFVGKRVDGRVSADSNPKEIWSESSIAFYDAEGNLNLIKVKYFEDKDGRITYIDEPHSRVYIKDPKNDTAHAMPKAVDYDRVEKFFTSLIKS